ncbi:hypothetical protein SARC_07599 [Sphaeroforma arctica JP610]|uniref:Uncharacterized protein n=1 Tax=Sphaeroforma arctica JP610 TaxID=667725 RepID=A0A0L0FVR7_9EUKA|nr:hypothetical protein SARC_07599 [Sphaeroforma arctica JP610]KNC80033.1 hypothetical protein SARC_07599 [Sphaeroforma arctica JP610]|eukprot:XP_014153935.1 hypothetical protein SARC_07599 [Sphaeroforma arctica JP610]
MSGNYYDTEKKTSGYTKVSRALSGAQYENIPHPLDEELLIGRVVEVLAVDISRAIFVKRAQSSTVVGMLIISIHFTIGVVTWIIKRKNSTSSHSTLY